MAAVYPVAPGHTVYSGTFIPEIWSTKLNYKFYDASIVPQIVNMDWEAEIKKHGEKVIIRTTPDITIRDYVKGQDLIYEEPEEETTELLIDQGHYWATQCDDVDKAQFDIAWQEKWSDDASEQLKIKVDNNVLNNVYPDIAAANKGTTAGRKSAAFNLGTSGSPIALTKTNILDYIVHVNTVLDEQNIPETGRWLVLPAVFCNLIKRSDLKDASLAGDTTSILRNGRIGMIDRTEVYKTNLLTGTDEGGSNAYHILGGHKSGITFAGQVTKTDTLKAQTTFAQLVRGLFVYGFKVNRPESVVGLYATATV